METEYTGIITLYDEVTYIVHANRAWDGEKEMQKEWMLLPQRREPRTFQSDGQEKDQPKMRIITFRCEQANIAIQRTNGISVISTIRTSGRAMGAFSMTSSGATVAGTGSSSPFQTF